MRVLFWGTPEFAAPALRALLGEGFEVVGVVTQPDRPRGRSRSSLVPSPIKQIAIEESIPVIQPEQPRGRRLRPPYLRGDLGRRLPHRADSRSSCLR